LGLFRRQVPDRSATAAKIRVYLLCMMPESRSVALELARKFADYKDRIESVSSQLRQHKAVIDLCPLPMFTADEEGRCVYVNNALCQITGIAIENWQHDLWKHNIHPDDVAGVVEAWNSFVQDPARATYEHQNRFVRHDGAVIEMLVKARQMPCKSIIGILIPTRFFSFVGWLRGADLENLPSI
jgi:PAS domain S-box-containing protein